jgi:DNA polymerase III epsilon subunit-like protein
MAVHHITLQMVQDKPLFKEASDYAANKELLEAPTTIVVAHNAPFDVKMLQKDGVNPVNSIDTLKIVRALDSEGKIPRHNLQFLRYFLDLDKDINTPIQAHDAKGDVIVLELLFERLAAKLGQEEQKQGDALLEKMMGITNEPSKIAKFAFGKHKGKMLAQVAKEDPGYLQWLLGQKQQKPEGEDDWIFTLKYHLGM